MASAARYALNTNRAYISNKWQRANFYMFRSTMGGIDHDDGYEERSVRFGLAQKEAVLEKAKKAIFLDVKSFDELKEKRLEGFNVVHIPCTMNDTSKVTDDAPSLLPDKNASIIIFCGIGGRAKGASDTLGAMGYTDVMNAGGLKDLGYLK